MELLLLTGSLSTPLVSKSLWIKNSNNSGTATPVGRLTPVKSPTGLPSSWEL